MKSGFFVSPIFEVSSSQNRLNFHLLIHFITKIINLINLTFVRITHLLEV